MSQDRAHAARLVALPHGQPAAVDTAQPDVCEIQRSTRRLPRRSLLHLGAAASAGTLVGIRPWATASAIAAAGPPAHLRRSSYTGLIGQSFALASGTLRLLSVSDVAGAGVNKSLAGAEGAFVLAFSRPLDGVLESGTHLLSHA